MEQLPDLKNLPAAETDELIEALWADHQLLRRQVALLEARVTELEAQGSTNSRNSSNRSQVLSSCNR